MPAGGDAEYEPVGTFGAPACGARAKPHMRQKREPRLFSVLQRGQCKRGHSPGGSISPHYIIAGPESRFCTSYTKRLVQQKHWDRYTPV
jgi:hypothetical protein